jgi:hypothetical protein
MKGTKQSAATGSAHSTCQIAFTANPTKAIAEIGET